MAPKRNRNSLERRAQNLADETIVAMAYNGQLGADRAGKWYLLRLCARNLAELLGDPEYSTPAVQGAAFELLTSELATVVSKGA